MLHKQIILSAHTSIFNFNPVNNFSWRKNFISALSLF